MVNPVFEMQGAGYQYPDGRTGLAEVTLAVAPGESVVVLGANASGKSTLLRLLGGVMFATEGRVTAFGEHLTEAVLEDTPFARQFRRRVGVLFQDTEAMLFNPTVYDEIAFGPLQLDLPTDGVKQRVADMLALLGLEHVAEQPPHALSGGEKRKVALAAILAVSPEVLLFDEPTASFDPRFQRWFVELAQALRAAGKTLVTATHDLHIVQEVGDHVVVLGEDHRMAATGPPQEVLRDLDLLYSVNLVHAHAHPHAEERHAHPHAHLHEHEHGNGRGQRPEARGQGNGNGGPLNGGQESV